MILKLGRGKERESVLDPQDVSDLRTDACLDVGECPGVRASNRSMELCRSEDDAASQMSEEHYLTQLGVRMCTDLSSKVCVPHSPGDLRAGDGRSLST